jgi:transposase
MSKRNSFRRKSAALSPQEVDVNPILKRVRVVGPEKFGLILVDPHKESSTVRTANFYGEWLTESTEFPHTAPALQELVRTVQDVLEEQGIEDAVAGVEMTGRYHRPVKRALGRHWDVKMIHPFTTKQLRQPAHPGIKTDDIDLDAMKRAMIAGYGKDEQQLPALYEQWRIISRMREDLVGKRSSIRAQCGEKIEGMMPGYRTLFDDFWDSAGAVAMAEMFGSADALLRCDAERIRERLRKRKITVMRSTVDRVRAWAGQAAEPDPVGGINRGVVRDYVTLERELSKMITRNEAKMLRYLVQTPAVALLALRGINVVSASGYASELGPVEHYLNPKRITGRAGLFPSRYQSAETDRADGPVVRGHNARLRHALMSVAFNLNSHNPHFRGYSEVRKKRGWPAMKTRTSVANRFTRISYHILHGDILTSHACLQNRHSVLGKIVRFALDYRISPKQTERYLKQAAEQLPPEILLYEVQALQQGCWLKKRNRFTARKSSFKMSEEIQRVIEHLWQTINKNQGDGTAKSTD